jgi:hypothetical protein
VNPDSFLRRRVARTLVQYFSLSLSVIPSASFPHLSLSHPIPSIFFSLSLPSPPQAPSPAAKCIATWSTVTCCWWTDNPHCTNQESWLTRYGQHVHVLTCICMYLQCPLCCDLLYVLWYDYVFFFNMCIVVLFYMCCKYYVCCCMCLRSLEWIDFCVCHSAVPTCSMSVCLPATSVCLSVWVPTSGRMRDGDRK